MMAEVFSNGESVWVNGGFTGGAIGRFGRNGIDVHSEDTASCLYCTHEPTTAADWETFKREMLRHHGVVVGDAHRPERLEERPDEQGP